ncbi:Hypothetical protein CINCED_3A002155 [Cinara cedri]|uniref:Uncharacterized protein n=1 Tax=Cinara cedri TaxID=506608 RepID=A0A5E4MZG5_9HEMI|nr:Hypothetical protein CINCED_3A002155 [Cinara cedri]
MHAAAEGPFRPSNGFGVFIFATERFGCRSANAEFDLLSQRYTHAAVRAADRLLFCSLYRRRFVRMKNDVRSVSSFWSLHHERLDGERRKDSPAGFRL